MNKKLIILLVVALAIIISAWYFWPKPIPEFREFNEDLNGSVDFDISDPKTGSSIVGTVFTMGSPDNARFTIVAHVNITDKDYGPIVIKLPDHMLITSGYTDLYDIYEPSSYFKHSGRSWVEIGFWGVDKGAGEGTVIIEGVFDPNCPIPNLSVIDVGLGWIAYRESSKSGGYIYVKGFD